MYFTMETQESIMAYQNLEKSEQETGEDKKDEKHKIYVEKIQPAFEKLVENKL